MKHRTIALCTVCRRAYAVRKHDDRLIVPTDDGNCSCGNDTFEEAT